MTYWPRCTSRKPSRYPWGSSYPSHRRFRSRRNCRRRSRHRLRRRNRVELGGLIKTGGRVGKEKDDVPFGMVQALVAGQVRVIVSVDGKLA